MQTNVITPDSGIEAIRHAASSMVRNRKITFELAWRMFLRDVRAMYRQSLLGYIWILLPPIANTVVWVYLNSQQVINIDTGDVPYPLYVLSGNLLWAAFNGMVIGMLTAVNEARGLISKINFPHEALLLSAFGKAGLNAIVPLVLLIPVIPFYGVPLGPQTLLFPLGLLALMLLGATFSILLLPIATLFTDVGRGMQLLLRFWFFLTPIIYPLPTQGIARLIAEWNPVTPILVTSRTWLIGNGPELLPAFLSILAITLTLLLIGIFIFKLAMPYLIERLSA